MARSIRTLSAGPGQGYGQVVQAPAFMHPVPPAHPVGHDTVPQELVPQLARHEHESLQSMLPHPLVPVQLTVHAPSPQLMLSHALPLPHAIVQLVWPVPQSMSPHEFDGPQVIMHDAASLQSIDEHAPELLHVMVQSKPLGQSTPPLQPGPGQLTRQLLVITLQPPLHSLGQFGLTQ